MATGSKQRVLRSGVVIAEKYRVDKAIARGGFSVIYRGTHIEMERPVALKLLALDDEIKPSWLERFTREARLASQLTHPNTVTIFDYGKDDRGFLYIVMEWVDGVSLYRHLKTSGALSPTDVAEITAQILQSLDEAHRRGFLHRDLKPSNIMLTEDYEGQDTVKVLDFGIAKHLESSRQKSGKDAARITHKGAFIGTPRYASPEQLDGEDLTPAADIYSLGLLMWEAIVGDPAVPSIEYGECVQRHLGEDPWRLPASVECPPNLAAILYRALEKKVEDRYQSCRQMHRELASWLQSAEARSHSDDSFFVAASNGGGSEAAGLGVESSGVDDEELFAGLVEESDDHGDAPIDLHGPSGGRFSLPERSSEPSAPSDDTFERELLALADTTVDRAEPPAAPKPSARPGPSQPGASISAAKPPSSSIDSQKLTVAISALAATVILAAGAYALLSNDDAPEATGGDKPAAVAEEEPPAAAGPSAQEIEKDLDDGTPTYSADTIWTALNQSGWRRIGKVDTLEFSDVTQSSARFRKKAKTVTVTIYQTDSLTNAARYVEAVDKPIQAIRFGKTSVQVAPGAKGSGTKGVYELMSMLFQLKAIAQDKGD